MNIAAQSELYSVFPVIAAPDIDPNTVAAFHAALDLPPDSSIIECDAVNREVHDRFGICIGGALVISYIVSRPDLADPTRHIIEIDDLRRPLPEDVITLLGLRAQENRQRGRFYLDQDFTRPARAA